MAINSKPCKPSRFLTEIYFPEYTYVPGDAPHPGRSETEHLPLDLRDGPELTPENWDIHQEYLFGIDLFTHGYYWEAQEHRDAVWPANVREGVVASLLRRLIKPAAAGVKVRESNEAGIEVHTKRAEEIFRELHTYGGVCFTLDVS